MATFPERALAWLNNALSLVMDAGLRPLAGLPPLVSLFLISLVSALLILIVMRHVSNQAGLSRSKRGMQASLLEIRLFKDDLRAVMSALRDGLRHNARYLMLSLVPLAWVAVPLSLIVVHLQAYYGYAGLTPGSPALITVTLHDEIPPDAAISLHAPSGLRVDTEAARFAGTNEVVWRILPIDAGDHVITVRVGAGKATKSVLVSPRIARRSPQRVSASLLGQLAYPSDPPLLPDGPIKRIIVTYPERELDIAGWHVHWTSVYIGLSIACAFALARPFGIIL